MLNELEKTGYPVFSGSYNYGMRNYEKMERFLNTSSNGDKAEIILYELSSDGGIGRREFVFDGQEMQVFYTRAAWNEKNTPVVITASSGKIKEWQYTEKGWFCFAYLMPEPPEVSEIVDGNVMIRVKPLTEEYRAVMIKYLEPLGYQGNNLLCADWNESHMEELDYNGLFEYLYTIKYKQRMDTSQYSEGIPKEEFESLLTEYLPISKEQLRQYAVYNAEKERYEWAAIGCSNYVPNAFGTSVSEITDMVENADGTVTLIVDAVCEMLGSDAVISHRLIVQFTEGGGIKYWGNQIAGNGKKQLPEYQYRVSGLPPVN